MTQYLQRKRRREWWIDFAKACGLFILSLSILALVFLFSWIDHCARFGTYCNLF